MAEAGLQLNTDIITALTNIDSCIGAATTSLANYSGSGNITIMGTNVNPAGASGSYAIGMLTDATSTAGKNFGILGKARENLDKTVSQTVS